MDRRHSSITGHFQYGRTSSQKHPSHHISPSHHSQQRASISSPIQNSVVSFVKKIVNKNTTPSPSESPISSPILGHNYSTLQQQQQPSSQSSSLSSSPVPTTPVQMANPSSSRGPLMHKIRQKMVSGSNRVMASLNPTSSLSTEQLTAHLTEEEKQIIQKVLLKEEQFNELASKSLSVRKLSGGNILVGSELSSPVESPQSGSHKQIERHNSIGQCRICRKRITNEEHHYHVCSNCNQYVCDDCSSYSFRDDTKYWMCSFCRRRGTQPALALGDGVLMKRMPSFAKMGRKQSSSETNKGRKPSLSEQSRQHSLEVITNPPHSPLLRSRSRPNSPPEDKYATIASDTEYLSDRRSSSESQSTLPISISQPSDSGFKSRDEYKKSYSMSDSSSNEDENNSMLSRHPTSVGDRHPKRRRSRKSKIQRQKRSLTSEENTDTFMVEEGGRCGKENINNNNGNNTFQYILPDGHRDMNVNVTGKSSEISRRKSSSSDVSDIHYDEHSCTSGDSPYWRSPRESADSDMLGLPPYSFGQRRSIPSLQIDTVVDSNHLTLRDCFARRSSTGRALPKIPDKEQARSMLDLPHSRKSSAHSLDLPIDQPRRASAPEGENIRIVIDEVDTRSQQNLANHHERSYERIILHRDERDTSNGTRGFGMRVVGGKVNTEDGSLNAFISQIIIGSNAAKMGLQEGDKILEWNGVSLINMSYEQVCHIMDTSGSSVELILERHYDIPGQHFVHQRRRLSSTQTSIDGNSINIPGRRKLPRVPPPSMEGSAEVSISVNQEQLPAPGGVKTERRSIDDSWKRCQSMRNTRHSVADLQALSMNESNMRERDRDKSDNLMQLPESRIERRKSSSALQQTNHGKVGRSISLKSEKSNESVNASNESLIGEYDSRQAGAYGEETQFGEVKLGMVMTKGMLEIEAICARGLPLSPNNQPPDTYVKFHLKDKKRGLLQKKKTRVVANDYNPVWRQIIKYDASIINGKSLVVSIWERQKGFDRNYPVGHVEIAIDQLKLHKLTIGWFKLAQINLSQWHEAN